MAEFVQFRLEESLPELKQMENIEIFSQTEIKQIIKKIKTFEYRLQRNSRSKQDYLKYIKYELDMLKLLQIRRQRLSKFNNKNIERSIQKRIKRLYKQVLGRYKSDVNLWLSFIDFCRDMKWNYMIGEQYSTMLKFHNNKPELWIAAAEWEYEDQGNSNVARNTLLKGLRFNKCSKEIYLKLFELELKHAKLMAEVKKEAEKKEESMEIDSDENLEVDTKLAKAVYKNAVKEIMDSQFAVSFLEISEKNSFTLKLSERIIADLQNRFVNDEFWRKTWAMKPLKLEVNDVQSESVLSAEKLCLKRFDEAVNKISTETMWTHYLTFCLDRLKVNKRSELITHTLNAFTKASSQHKLSSKLIVQWANLAEEKDKSLCDSVLCYATKQYPTKAKFWERRVTYYLSIEHSEKQITQLFDQGMKAIHSNKKSFNFWKMALQWYLITDPKKVKSFFEESIQKHRSFADDIKLLYFDWMCAEHGYEEIWEFYKKLWSVPPICIDIFNKMQNVLEAMPQPSIKRLRRVMASAQSNFGINNIDVWINSMNIEKYSPVESNRRAIVYERAVKTLNPELLNEFITHHTLQTTLIDD